MPLNDAQTADKASSNGKIDIAARWYADQGHTRRRAVIPTLRTKFGLTNLQAVEALKIARSMPQEGEDNTTYGKDISRHDKAKN